MQRRVFLVAIPVACAAGVPGLAQAAVTSADAATGIRAALERGAASAVALLGRPGGFLDNPKVRIPLPPALEQASGVLKLMGQQRRVDELVTAMNRAAEAAVPEAKALLVEAVRSMSVEDALGIVRGGDTSVTDFFASRTRQPLTQRFLPIVTRATEKVSLAQSYNELVGKAGAMGLVKAEDANLERHVTAKAVDGLYLMIGEEERRIRQDPIATGSAILQKVFGR
ncbi:DUF4197 domain-containing protein [Azohydromonas lata]|uniref:DUF4197 domain-containing protein n=1 Tax=Azohydromonas lata TaxID=45677 RepID=A0ABU5ILY4_9BURK|nr:DUF4197 domain-containing protein [Azohydromonas lata]MDZ5459913.1 DUF4197 domain-containing protein [Azohydromonas lata]